MREIVYCVTMMYNTRTIEFTANCKFLDTWVIKISMPYDPLKSIISFNDFWKKVKPAVSDCVGGAKITLQRKVIKQKTDRIVYKWPNGAMLDMPVDATTFDYSIVAKQFEVLSMAAKS